MSYTPRPEDGTYGQVGVTALPHVRAGHAVHLKWTCPKCGERVGATDPLTLVLQDGRLVVGFRPAYRHDERQDGSWCGQEVDVTAYRFNYAVIMRSARAQRPSA